MVHASPKTIAKAFEFQSILHGNTHGDVFGFVEAFQAQTTRQRVEVPAAELDRDRDLEVNHLVAVDDHQGILPEAVLGAGGLAAAKVLWDVAKTVTPLAIDWLRKHHHSHTKPLPTSVKCKQVQETAVRVTTYALLVSALALVAWEVYKPTGNQKLIIRR